ncbi:antitoxin of the YeeV-YeeU toxin-antitoxin system; CP4-44 prophage [Escherichia coli]|uniref:Antitoxin of the YeeV-YeeU toxin-antitoxin system CP4-44 prophage n=2 Tax=Escherichia coli TaxID=562 RepID=A0A484X511_ECOLX|nr:antitoxin of the YeeV-YeeU toxin-antitoxin system; CP4-44 prophage [Escherichia coli]
MSDTLPGTTLPDDNHDRPWWGLPCTVTPCFGARLVQEGNRLHYLADRAGIRGLFSDADAYHLDQAFPLLMKQLELMLTSGETESPPSAYRHAVCKRADLQSRYPQQLWLRLSGCLSDARNEKLTLQNSLLLRPGVFTTPLFHFYICISGKSSV